MQMRIAVAREADPAEARVAATPETVKKLKALGADVAVARGAGIKSGILDADLRGGGRDRWRRTPPRTPTWCSRCAGPSATELAGYKKGALVIAIMDPYGNEPPSSRWRMPGLAFAMELMPRITRAQSMDVLSSQANLGGLPRGDRCGRGIRPRAADDDDGGRHRSGGEGLHHGGGRRRPAGDRDGAAASAPSSRRPTCGRPPRNRSRAWAPSSSRSRTRNSRTRRRRAAMPSRCRKEYQAKQAALTAEHVKKQDIVITTALIPGPPGAAADQQGHGGLDAAGLGDRRSRGRARRQCAKAPSPARW